MDYILGGIILLLFGYIIYQDRLNRIEREKIDKANREEREKLEMKLMSRTTKEYKVAAEDPPPNTESKPDPYVDTGDVPIDDLMDAEDKL